jgi:chromosome segregation ATPase
MYRAISFLVASLLATTTAVAQTASTDTQLTQALLTEIRQLRQDLQTTAASFQRVQLVMFRVQAEIPLMTRATQRLDEVRDRCRRAQFERKMRAAQLEQTEQTSRNSLNQSEQKIAVEMVPQFKADLERLANEEQQCQTLEVDAETQFRAEQAKMTELQDQLDKLDKALEAIGKK